MYFLLIESKLTNSFFFMFVPYMFKFISIFVLLKMMLRLSTVSGNFAKESENIFGLIASN